MPGTIQKKHQSQTTTPVESEEVTTPSPSSTTSPTELLEETAALLDEIEEVLDSSVIERRLTLADLIREGAEMAPQTYGAWEQEGATCALGAAYHAAKARNLV